MLLEGGSRIMRKHYVRRCILRDSEGRGGRFFAEQLWIIGLPGGELSNDSGRPEFLSWAKDGTLVRK